MHEVRVESLEKLESANGEVRLRANSGQLDLVFPKKVWEDALREAPNDAPSEAESEELRRVADELKRLAKDEGFTTVVEGVRAGGSDLVLRSSELYAVTTGYLFPDAVDGRLVEEVGAALRKDRSVEQVYIIGAVASDEALFGGDDDLKIVSVRGRRSSTSRFEMAPELWRVLSEKLGWSSISTVIPKENKK